MTVIYLSLTHVPRGWILSTNPAFTWERLLISAADNKALLERVYAEISKGNIQPLLDSLADDVRWTIIGSTVLSGTRHGKQEVLDKLLKPLRARLADGPVVFHPDRFIAEGDYVDTELITSALAA